MKTQKLHKKTKQFLAEIALDGWTAVGFTGSGHIKVHHPSGATYILSGSPSDHRAEKNARSGLRNAVKQAEQNSPRGYRN